MNPARNRGTPNPSAMHATKKLMTLNQMVLGFMTVALVILLSANLLVHYQHHKSDASPGKTEHLNHHRQYSSMSFQADQKKFDQLSTNQHQQMLHQQEILDSSEKSFQYHEGHPPFQVLQGNREEDGRIEATEDFGASMSGTIFSELPKADLPSFSVDFSEFVFNSLIEIANEKKFKYYLTLQLLSHYNLRPSEAKRLKILKSHQSIWENALNAFQETKYYPNGKRREKPFIYCRVSYPKWNIETSQWYDYEEVILAESIPNRLTTNSAVNKRIDVLRCPLNETNYEMFLALLGKSKQMSHHHDLADHRHLQSETLFSAYDGSAKILVELIKEDKPILHYSIDIATRMTGYLMDFLHPLTTSLLPTADMTEPERSAPSSQLNQLPASKLAIWPEEDYDHYYTLNLFNFSPKVFLCIPQINKPLSRNNIALFLEFVAHHLLLGIDHIFIPTIWSETSVYYQRLLQLFASYIAEGKVSVISQASNYRNRQLMEEMASSSHLNGLTATEIPYEFYGVLWDKFFLKTLQANTCLYLSKGIADYVLFLDIDQFFIPKVPPSLSLDAKTLTNPVAAAHPRIIFQNLLLNMIYSKELLNYGADLVLKMKKEEWEWTGGPGWADGHHHPLCYLIIHSEAMLSVKGPKQYDRNWLAMLFHHGSEKQHKDASIQRRIQQDRILLPTRTIYYTGAYHPGVCRLSWQWNGCHDPNQVFCYDPKSPMLREETTSSLTDHRFDEQVTSRDAKEFRSEEEAVIYHYSYYDRRVSASPAALQEENLYTSYYFPYVYQDLSQRGLSLLIDLPETTPELILGKTKHLNITILSSKDVHQYDSKMENDDFSASTSFSSESNNDRMNLQDFTVHIPKAEMVSLPSFAADLSEIFLHAMIERSVPSYDLSVAVFLLNHQFIHQVISQVTKTEAQQSTSSETTTSSLDLDEFLQHWKGIQAIHPNAVAYWQEILSKFEDTVYDSNQAIRMRKNAKDRPLDVMNRQKFQCRIHSTSASSSVYLVDAIFVPHYRQSTEEQQLLQIDILRCPLPNSQFLYHQYANCSEEKLEVEILKDDLSILHFAIPWKERSTGMMAFPSQLTYDRWVGQLFHSHEFQSGEGSQTIHHHQSYHGHHVSFSEIEEDDHEAFSVSSFSSSAGTSGITSGLLQKEEEISYTLGAILPMSLESWKGFSRKTGGLASISSSPPDQLYLGVILEEEDSLAEIVEFLEYYLTILSVDHIILASPYSWISWEMKSLLRSLSPYLQRGQVSIVSMMDPTYHTSSSSSSDAASSSSFANSQFLLGAIVSKQVLHHLFSNLCLYYSKGMAELLGILKVQDYILSKKQSLVESSSSLVSSKKSLYQLLKEGIGSEEEKKTCLYQIPRKTVIHLRDDDDDKISKPFFHFISTDTGTSSAKPILKILSEGDTTAPAMMFVPISRLYYISTMTAGGRDDDGMKSNQVYACRVEFPYHGCNDRSTFCYSSTATDTTDAAAATRNSPVYFDQNMIPSENIHQISEESLVLTHLLDRTPQQLQKEEERGELLTEDYQEAWLASYFSKQQKKASSVSQILQTSLLEHNRSFVFSIPDSYSTQAMQELTRHYHQRLLRRFTTTTADSSLAEEKEEKSLPSFTRDRQSIVVSAIWDRETKEYQGKTEMRTTQLTLIHLLLSPRSGFWLDFVTSATASSSAVEEEKDTWQSYLCQVSLTSENGQLLPLKTITTYEEVTAGIGFLRCRFSLPPSSSTTTATAQRLIVSWSKPAKPAPHLSLRSSSSSSEMSGGEEVLRYEMKDQRLGQGFLFPAKRIQRSSSSSGSVEEERYLQNYEKRFFSRIEEEKDDEEEEGGDREKRINLCYTLPWENVLTKETLSLLVESITHHLQLGIHHLYLTIRLYPATSSTSSGRSSESASFPISEGEEVESQKRLYLQGLAPFLKANQLTLFFLGDSDSFTGAGSASSSEKGLLELQMSQHFLFVQQYSMQLAYLLSQRQQVQSLAYWQISQLLVLPPLFEEKKWTAYWKHYAHHWNRTTSSSSSSSSSSSKSIGIRKSFQFLQPNQKRKNMNEKIDLNEMMELMKDDPPLLPSSSTSAALLPHFLAKIRPLCPAVSSSAHTTATPSVEDSSNERYYLLHSLAVPMRELTNHLLFHPDQRKNHQGSHRPPLQFLGDLYESSPDYYRYYREYSANFQFRLDDYPGYLEQVVYPTSLHSSSRSSYEFGLILSFPGSNQDKNSNRKKTVSPFLSFLWHDYLPTAHKGKILPEEILPRAQTVVIDLAVAELQHFYDFQELFNLQQLALRPTTTTITTSSNNQKKRQRRLSKEGELDVLFSLREANNSSNNRSKEGELREMIQMMQSPPEPSEPEQEEQAEEEKEEEKEDEEEAESSIASFFSSLLSKVSSSSQSSNHPPPTKDATASERSLSSQIRSKLVYFQRKEQSFSHKLQFLHFQRPSQSSPLEVVGGQRQEIALEGAATHLTLLCRPEQLESQQESQQQEKEEEEARRRSSFETFVEKKIALQYFLDLDPFQSSPSSKLEENYQLLNKNLYSSFFYPEIVPKLIRASYDVQLLPTTAKNSRSNRKQQQDKSYQLWLRRANAVDFLTVFKTRILHD